jgi:ABC-2 type transport system permease protein
MNLQRTWAIFRKELIHIRRDTGSLIQALLLPIFLLLLYGYALNLDVKHVALAVYDQEKSSLSRDFIDRFTASRYFTLHDDVNSYPEVNRLIDDRGIWLALVIPYDFSRRVKSGQTANVQALIDGTDANTANIVLSYVQAIILEYSQRLAMDRAAARGLASLEVPLQGEIRVWFNEELESRNYIIPGLIAVIMTMVGSLLTAMIIVRETERGSMESLAATPLKKTEVILGKLGPYFLIGMFNMVLAIILGHGLFDIPIRGNHFFLLLVAALFVIVVLGQGLLISVTAQNQLQAYQMAVILAFFPAVFLSGYILPIRQMPLALQYFTYLFPPRYFVTILKGIYLKGVGLKILWFETLALTGFALLFLTIAIARFVKKMK